jgi:assimilatory nitrate reductase catalytic subunit
MQGLLHNKPDYLVCTCMGVMYSEIIQALDQGCKTLEELSDQLMVMTGCSSCKEEILFIMHQYKQATK